MATKTVGGFRHLAGLEAYVFLSGYLYKGADPDEDYTDVSIQTIDNSGNVVVDSLFFGTVTVGLGYTMELETLPISMEAQAATRGTVKSVNKVYARANGSGVLKAGPTSDKLVDMQLTETAAGEIPPLVEIPVLGDWNGDARMVFQHSDPEPVMIQSLVLDVTTGG